MSNHGWIKAHRLWLEHPVINKDADHFCVWMYLCLNATHKEHQTYFGGKIITLKPGQVVVGRKSIAESLKGVNENKIYRVLKRFKSEQLIEQQTSSKNTLITLINWDSEQNSEQLIEQQLNNNRTTTEQQLNTYNNVRMKEDKNEKIFLSLGGGSYRNHLVDTYGEECVRFYELKYRKYKKTTTTDYSTIEEWIIKDEHNNDGFFKSSKPQPSSSPATNDKIHNFGERNHSQQYFDDLEQAFIEHINQ